MGVIDEGRRCRFQKYEREGKMRLIVTKKQLELTREAAQFKKNVREGKKRAINCN